MYSSKQSETLRWKTVLYSGWYCRLVLDGYFNREMTRFPIYFEVSLKKSMANRGNSQIAPETCLICCPAIWSSTLVDQADDKNAQEKTG